MAGDPIVLAIAQEGIKMFVRRKASAHSSVVLICFSFLFASAVRCHGGDIIIYFNLNAAQHVVYREGTLLAAYS